MGRVTSIDGNGDGDGEGNGDGYGYGYSDGVVEVEHATPIMAWHYVPLDGLTRYPHLGELRRVQSGLVLEWAGALEMCKFGLHASLTQEDARSYCDGILTRVACSGRVIVGLDKLVCSRREVIEVIG